MASLGLRTPMVFAALVSYLLHFAIVFRVFIYKYVDSDQLIQADMALNYSKGNVPEPYFWGQNYNFPVESWFATPLVMGGVRADVATIAVSALLFYLPFLLALHFLREYDWRLRFLILTMPFMLPTEFLLVVLMPRNFGTTTGLATSMLLVIAFTKQPIVKEFSAFALGVAISSFIAIAPLVVLLVQLTRRTPSKTKIWICFILGFTAVQALGLYYRFNPEAVVSYQKNMSLSVSSLVSNLKISDLLLLPLSIFFTPILIATVVGAYRSRNSNPNNNPLLFGLLGSIVVASLLLLSTEKILDYQESVLYSGYRFWTWVPMAVLLAFSTLGIQNFELSKSSSFHRHGRSQQTNIVRVTQYAGAGCIVLILISMNSIWIARNAESMVAQPTFTDVALRSDIVEKCELLTRNIDKEKEYLFIPANDYWLDYGCPTYTGVFTLMAERERRTWGEEFVAERNLTRVLLEER